MGASTSAQRDGKNQKDASAEVQNVEANEIREGESIDSKLLQKNGQISGLNGTADDQTNELDVIPGEKVLVEVGQTDSVLVPQKEEVLEVMEVLQEEAAPQLKIETEEKESPDANDITPTEEKAPEEEQGEASEVGFKKIFKFVGFKFTLKKDKSEKAGPVQLLTVKNENEAGGSEVTEEAAPSEESKPAEAEKTPEETEAVAPPENTAEETVEETEPTKEVTPESESPTSPVVEEVQSPLKRFFTQGIFANLRKRPSFKKPAEEAPPKTTEEELNGEKETTESPTEEGEKAIEEAPPELQKEEVTPEEPKADTEMAPVVEGEQCEGEIKVEEEIPQTTLDQDKITLPADISSDVKTTEEAVEDAVTGPDEDTAAVTTEADLLSSQEKAKVHGSPLKKLFSGAGLKKRSGKKLKGKKEAETKLTESGEHAAEQLQSSTESAENQRVESPFSSPEESGEHVNGEPTQAEVEGDAVISDGEKKKDGIPPWASFKKLVTPKKRVKRSSESEDEAIEKPKSATMSSGDSAVFIEQQEEPKPSEEEQKIELSTEEPKKKDSSVSWEALLCGSAKKRARKTSDSEEEEEEPAATAESPLGSSQEGDHEILTSSPEQAGSPSEGDGGSTWASLKRLVTPRRRVKAEDKAEDQTEQIPSDSEITKEEPSFSLKRLIPGRRKKRVDGKQEQISSDEAGKDVGSAEEDSDTPAVIPLSEFDLPEPEEVDVRPKEEEAEKQVDTTEIGETVPELSLPELELAKLPEALPPEDEQAQEPSKADTEEQLLSEIPPTVEVETEEQMECITKYQQLSDIPEEGVIEDTTATPVSTAEEVCQDDTIAEDFVELTSEAVTALEQAPEESVAEESTEMVSAVSRLTESPATSGETTPVPAEYEVKETEAVLQEAVEAISLATNDLSVTMTDDQQETVAMSVCPQVIESASVEETKVLAAHEKSEATAICIGLDSQEIKPVEEEPIKTSVEGITEVSEAVSTEIVSEDKAEKSEAAGIAQDEVYEAEVEEIKTELQETEATAEAEEILQEAEIKAEQVNQVENELSGDAVDKVLEVMQMEEANEVQGTESANELQEVTPVQVAVVDSVQGEAELLERQVVIEDKPQTEAEGPIESVVEEPVCGESAEVTEMPVMEGEKEQELEDVEKSEADVENAPVAEVVQCLTQEVTASMPEPPTTDISVEEEAPIAVHAPAVELAMAGEASDIVSPPTESVQSEMAEIKDEVVMERVPSVQLTDEHEIQVEVKYTDLQSVELAVEAEIEAAATDVCVVEEDICETVQEEEEVMVADQLNEAVSIEEQGSIIVQEIIQSVMENLPETAEESEDAEAYEHAEMDTVIPEEMIPSSDFKDELQGVEQSEADSMIASEAEVPTEDTTVPLEMPLDSDIQVEMQAPPEEEVEDALTQSEVAETEEESKDNVTGFEVQEEAEVAAERLASPVPEQAEIADSAPVESKEDAETAGEHHEEVLLEARDNMIQETDAGMEIQEEQEAEDSKVTVEEVVLQEVREETEESLEIQAEPEVQVEAAEGDQTRVEGEGGSQEEGEVTIELQHQEDLPDSHDEETEVKQHQEVVEEVPLDVSEAGAPSQVEETEGLVEAEAPCSEETTHVDTEQESPAGSTMDSEISKDLIDTTTATAEEGSQKEEEVQSQATTTDTESQAPQAETCSQEVEIIEEECQAVEEIHIEAAVDSMTHDAAETRQEDSVAFPMSFLSKELEADIAQISVEETEQVTAVTVVESRIETVETEEAQIQECLSEEVKSQEAAIEGAQEPTVEGESMENGQALTLSDGEAEAIQVKAEEQVPEVVTRDPVTEDAMLMAHIDTAETIVQEVIEESMKEMEPSSSQLTAAS
ncbi:A-kinase anchor protein 12 [Megalops cyprinoides]|uniref:A-kinase anchor protein 12 n=1 Tax=Megalops cyprinoides TaxID=118141 RepID=UPI001863B64F|nr:A-kinase anchor protein 12 [Megalops cyprinoides]